MTALTASPLLSLRGVSKIFGAGDAAFVALRDVDLDIHAGEFVAILGACVLIFVYRAIKGRA